MGEKREDIIQSAVKFLKDPKVASSPLAKKIAFLESKGLSSEEIEEAVSRSNGGNSNTTTTTTTTSSHVNNANVPAANPPLSGPYTQQQPMVPYYGQALQPGQPPYAGPPVPYYGSQGQQGPPHMMQQGQQSWSLQQMSWKDYFIGAVVTMGASYGMFQLIKVRCGLLAAGDGMS